MDAARQYSTQDAARILQTTESRIRNWARLGGVEASPGPGGEFTFQQLLMLRTTRGLLEAGIPAKRVREVWSSLRRQLNGELPLTSVRILADGSRAIAWDENAPWQPDSGQFVLDFDAGATPAPRISALRMVDPLPVPVSISAEPASRTAEQWFDIACELEESSPKRAREAYAKAIELDPACADAHLNLGRLEHEAGELGKAEALYRRAVQCDPKDPIPHFNLGVLLEDRERPDEAAAAYHQAIVRDPAMADAHYNLGLLLEARGRRDDALKHLMAAQRLYQAE